MPSETMDSPSIYTDGLSSHDERQDGFWKTKAVHKFNGTKSNGSLSPFPASPVEKRISVNSEIGNGFSPADSYLSRDQITSISEKNARMSLPRGFEHIIGSASYSTEGDKVNFTGAPYENGLFSSSLSELFSRKLRLSSTTLGHSVGAAEPHEEEEPFESLKELEAQTIGNLLPDDDEDLFSGVSDGISRDARRTNGDEIEEDLFCSVGGLELGEDGDINSETLYGNSNSQLRGSIGTSGVEHPAGEHPSRTLFVRNIDSNIEDSELQSLFQQYGDIRTLYTASKHRGFVMISYYDIRAAWNAMKALQKKPLRNRNLDVHFSIPKDTPSEKDVNQGTLVVFNLNSSVSNDELCQTFGVYGEIKKIYEVPHSHHQKFIEFYDVRAAEAALRALNRANIAGKRINLEARLPGVVSRSMYSFASELEQEKSSMYQQQSIPPNLMTGLSGSISLGGMASNVDNASVLSGRFSGGFPMSPYLENEFLNGISASVPSSLPSLLSVGSTSNVSNSIEASNSLGQLKFDIRGTPSFHPHSLPDHHNGLANGAICNSPGSMAVNIGGRSPELLEKPFGRVNPGVHPIDLNGNVFNITANGNGSPGQQHYMWSRAPRPQPQGIMYPNSPSFINGTCSPNPQQIHGIARAPSHLSSGFLPINNHHVGSAPSVNPSLLERRNVFAAKSPDASVFNPGSLGSMSILGGSPHFMEFVPHNMFSSNGGSMDFPTPKNLQMHPQNQRCMVVPGRGQMVSMMSSYDSPSERARSRRNEGSSSQGDNRKQFELDIDRIMLGEDKRTTLMIKNIPNKYTSKMLLASIDERHRGSYDFLYLPIDFKNKCNVGYAFINMTEPSSIVPFYQAFNGKKWEKFNSEKVALLAYARIQGKVALISHFQNSSLMNEDKRCRPILFHTDGPNAGDQVPFPMGVSIRPRAGKNRTSTSEENNQESLPNSSNEEESSGGEASVSGKD
ncbi:RNA metabolism protein [Lithospermum erythrorhizon]|uniref:RNA metabolism protein n=1 Tax=Lithospermum erythrorhizon TaxID=34254 RepID=A0AAV3NSR1_LITER